MKPANSVTVSITLLSSPRPLIDRAMHLSQQVRRYDPALAALLVKNESKARKGTNKGKRMVQLDGVKGKSGRFPVDSEKIL